ncbi:MAG: putative glycolipid-binding domain-containing protein [Anaerolineae bacterium]|nr:putative glycolipid-binding domain-containing protein [Anaerolineae bacterium]
MTQHLSTVLWRFREEAHSDFCVLSQSDAGYELEGVVLRGQDGQPIRIDYHVRCDRAWRTTATTIAIHENGGVRRLEIVAQPDGQWQVDGEALAVWQGCTDIDLGFSPATNTVAIGRLKLAVGQSAELDAAWVRWPGFTFEVLPQRYTRLADDRYLYESRNGSFQATLIVDAHGMVLDYENLWHAVAHT